MRACLAVMLLVVIPHFHKKVVGIAVVSQCMRFEIAAHLGRDLQLQRDFVSGRRLFQILHGFDGFGRFALASWFLKGADVGHYAALVLEMFSIAVTTLCTTVSARLLRLRDVVSVNALPRSLARR